MSHDLNITGSVRVRTSLAFGFQIFYGEKQMRQVFTLFWRQENAPKVNLSADTTFCLQKKPLPHNHDVYI